MSIPNSMDMCDCSVPLVRKKVGYRVLVVMSQQEVITDPRRTKTDTGMPRNQQNYQHGSANSLTLCLTAQHSEARTLATMVSCTTARDPRAKGPIYFIANNKQLDLPSLRRSTPK